MQELAAEIKHLGQTVLVLQGGGALGAYQAGVYQALHEAGIEPDWVIGASIGAVNAALIIGNDPGMRMKRLREFWKRVEFIPYFGGPTLAPMSAAMHSMLTMAGHPGFSVPIRGPLLVHTRRLVLSGQAITRSTRSRRTFATSSISTGSIRVRRGSRSALATSRAARCAILTVASNP